MSDPGRRGVEQAAALIDAYLARPPMELLEKGRPELSDVAWLELMPLVPLSVGTWSEIFGDGELAGMQIRFHDLVRGFGVILSSALRTLAFEGTVNGARLTEQEWLDLFKRASLEDRAD